MEYLEYSCFEHSNNPEYDECLPSVRLGGIHRSFTRLQFEAEFGRRFGRYRILAPEILKVLIGGQASDFGLVDVQFTAQMVGFMLEDAGRPAVQMLLVLFAVFILPAGCNVEPVMLSQRLRTAW